jgi:hypothetical protein
MNWNMALGTLLMWVPPAVMSVSFADRLDMTAWGAGSGVFVVGTLVVWLSARKHTDKKTV